MSDVNDDDDTLGVSGDAPAIRLSPLGGVGNFGRNCLLVEDLTSGCALVVDCGVRFVSDEVPGFDVGLPDLARIQGLGEQLLAYVVTHGHEDHVGALPFAARLNDAPIFATPFTARVIASRFARHDCPAPDLEIVHAGECRRLGPFEIEWIAVSHSIPDATAVRITTAAGVLVHSGDFRVDDDPVLGPPTDLERLTRIGDEGVLALLADSTGARIPGQNPGEKSVLPALEEAMTGAPGRVVVALFASHLQRLALVAQCCRRVERKLALLGRGLLDAASAAHDLGLLAIDDVLVDERTLARAPASTQCFAVTGTQGEAHSALNRLASGHPALPLLGPGDRVVLSARVIPGNERRVHGIIDQLVERGVEVVDGRAHVSGHGYLGDLELLCAALRPRTFIALHGDARHLRAHDGLALRLGVPAAHVVDMRDGHSVILTAGGSVEHVVAPRAAEPLAQDRELSMQPGPIVAARRRMAAGGLLLLIDDGDDVRVITRGMATALPADLLQAMRDEGPAAIRKAGTLDEPHAIRALAKHFWRARRTPPEIVLVPRLDEVVATAAIADDG